MELLLIGKNTDHEHRTALRRAAVLHDLLIQQFSRKVHIGSQILKICKNHALVQQDGHTPAAYLLLLLIQGRQAGVIFCHGHQIDLRQLPDLLASVDGPLQIGKHPVPRRLAL